VPELGGVRGQTLSDKPPGAMWDSWMLGSLQPSAAVFCRELCLWLLTTSGAEGSLAACVAAGLLSCVVQAEGPPAPAPRCCGSQLPTGLPLLLLPCLKAALSSAFAFADQEALGLFPCTWKLAERHGCWWHFISLASQSQGAEPSRAQLWAAWEAWCWAQRVQRLPSGFQPCAWGCCSQVSLPGLLYQDRFPSSCQSPSSRFWAQENVSGRRPEPHSRQGRLIQAAELQAFSSCSLAVSLQPGQH